MADPGPMTPRSRINPVRAVVAVLIVIGLLVGALGYHDAAFDVDDLSEATEPGDHRFKGTLESWDAGREEIVVRDESGAAPFHWNVTSPKVGRVYVVVVTVDEDGQGQAVALSRAYLFQGRWA